MNFEDRAKAIHGDKFGKGMRSQYEQSILDSYPSTANFIHYTTTEWSREGRTFNDLVHFYAGKFPQYPVVLVIAMAKSTEESFKQHESVKEPPQQKWDFMSEIEQARVQGLTQLAVKNMDELLLDETKEKKERKRNQKAKNKQHNQNIND